MLFFNCKAPNIADSHKLYLHQDLFDSFLYHFATGEQGSRGMPGPPGEPGAKGPIGGYQKTAVFICGTMSFPPRVCFREHRQGNNMGVKSYWL